MKLTALELLELQDQAWENGYEQGLAGNAPRRPRDVGEDCVDDEVSIPPIAITVEFRVKARSEDLTSSVVEQITLGGMLLIPPGSFGLIVTEIRR